MEDITAAAVISVMIQMLNGMTGADDSREEAGRAKNVSRKRLDGDGR